MVELAVALMVTPVILEPEGVVVVRQRPAEMECRVLPRVAETVALVQHHLFLVPLSLTLAEVVVVQPAEQLELAGLEVGVMAEPLQVL